MNQNNTPRMLPPRKAAAELGLTEHCIRSWIKSGYIGAVPAGKKLLINVDTLKRKLSEV